MTDRRVTNESEWVGTCVSYAIVYCIICIHIKVHYYMQIICLSINFDFLPEFYLISEAVTSFL